MPTYLAPGVYVEEPPPKARPIAGVGTSTAGFVGIVPNNITMPEGPGSGATATATITANVITAIAVTNGGSGYDGAAVTITGDGTGATANATITGGVITAIAVVTGGTGYNTATVTVVPRFAVAPVGIPQLVSSWEEFKKKFGDFQTGNSVLAQGVYGFFNNGGKNCWVSRVADLSTLATDLEKFEPIDEIAIVAVPGAASDTQRNAITAHCEKMKDRVCVLDGNQNLAGNVAYSDIQGSTTISKFAAMYWPWIKVNDPITKTLISQPPSGHVAGVYARVDSTRGVFKAPANEPILGANNVDRLITRNQQELINPKGINAIRFFDGAIKVYGGRTLGGDDNGDMRYISTRRYMNFLVESIDEGTQFVVFEPNSPALWQRIIRSVSDFLYNQWREGGLFGETAKQAFFVKCDAELNPPSVREAGQVITEIGVAIVKPAEFVIFRIEQISGS